MKHIRRCLMLVFVLYLVPASGGESERIQGVAQFLLERANYNYVYLFEYRIKNNKYFQCYFPVTYSYAASGNLTTLLRSGQGVWDESIQQDINGLLNRALALLIADSKPAVIEFMSRYIELMQNLAVEIDGKTYPLDTIPVDAPQKVKDAINRFYLFAEPFEQLTKIQTRLKSFTANIDHKTGCLLDNALPQNEQIGDVFDTLKNINDQFKGKFEEQIAVFKEFKNQLRPTEKAQAKIAAEVSKQVDKFLNTGSKFAKFVTYFKTAEPRFNTLKNSQQNDVIKVIQVETLVEDGIQAGTFPGSANFNAADFNRFKQYIIFFAEVSQAKSPDQVKSLLSEVTLPPVSFGIKRTAGGPRFLISAYVGASGFWENTPEDGHKFGYGVFAPIGLEYVFLRHGGNSFSAMLAPFDFAHPLNLEIADQNEPVEFNDIVNPGVYLSWGVKDLPLTLGVGYSKGRAVRSQTGKESRYLLFVAFDLPLFNLY